MRRFIERFRGRELEVALEATTGWRVRWYIWPSRRRRPSCGSEEAREERSGGRPARRELLMVGRLPESWIPSDHILDLRARVRLRHTLGEQRSEWQQRIQAALYHHGCPQRRSLLVGDGRAWLQVQELPQNAREEVTVALAMIDGLERQITPIERELRCYARSQPGCKALMAHYRIGELTAVTIRPSCATAPASPPRGSRCATPAPGVRCGGANRL